MDNLVAHDIDTKERTEDVKIEESITFNTMLLPDYLLQGLKSVGFKKPSPIQLAAIPRARCGLDLIVQAKSGTGKTLVFTVTALESININLKRVQAIIIAPTREIAIQIADVIRSVGSAMKGLKVSVLVGGRPLSWDKPDVQSCHIAVGCPGRLRHLIEQNILDSQAVRLLVLDEADKLFHDEYDYQKDIIYIYNKCGESKQVLALSATYPPKMLEFTQRFMRSGQHVTPSGGPTPVLLGLRQMILITRDHPDYNARMSAKEKELFHILETVPFDQCCIFHHYATRADSMNNVLKKKGFASICLTSKQNMEERQDALNALKSNRCRILVTTDIAARGIDAANVNLVINMGLPWDPASYLHRMGRAGRYGSQGVCISLISDGLELNKFQKLLGQIGGTSMAVNVIPKFQKYDLWSDDLSDFDKLYGVLPNGDEGNDNGLISIHEQESIKSNDNNVQETSEKAPNRDKTTKNHTFSLKELQLELDRFVEREKQVKINSPRKHSRKPSSPKQKVATYSEVLCRQKKGSRLLEKMNLEKAEPSKPQLLAPVKELPKDATPSSSSSTERERPSKALDASLLNESRKNKRKRDNCFYSSSSSEFESDSYYIDDTDETMYTVDEDSPSGIDLNADEDDFESLSIITSEDRKACKCYCHDCYKKSQTDWYSVISKEINNYVMYCRRFQVQ